MLNTNRALYISYNGALEEILFSQVIPYLRELNKQGYGFTLLTFEKKERLIEVGKKGILELKAKLKKEGIDWYWLRYHKRISIVATSFDILLGAIYASWLVVTRKTGIVHARSIVPGIICLLLKVLGVKFIFDTRGLLAEEYVGGGHWKEGEFKYIIIKFFEKLCLRIADAIVVLTRRHHAYLLNFSWLKNRNNTLLEIIPCCVDLDRFKYNPCPESGLLTKKSNSRDDFIFTYLGKIGKHYMLREMLDFLKYAFTAIPNSKFMIFSQNEESQVLNIISTAGIDRDRVIVKKPAFEEIPSLISASDAGIFFINPYKKFGSSPIKLAEFLGCGVPVIINSGIGDTEEFVKENKVGVVLNAFDDDNYKNTLFEFLELAKEGMALNKRCRKVAEDYLSLNIGVGKYSSIYKRLFKCTA